MPLPAMTAFRVFLILASHPGTKKHFVRLVKGGRDWWAGRKIAVIGPVASGKDSFLARLQNKEIPETHAKSSRSGKIGSFKVKLALSQHRAIDITCKGVINIGGGSDYRDAPSGWLSVCKDADVVFYVMTITDLYEKRFLKGRRIRQDLNWLMTALPYLKRGALIHILINKIDQEIESHTGYRALSVRLDTELRAFERTVNRVLHPYEARYSGATLISMQNKQIYTLAINDALRAVYSAFHGTVNRKKAA